MKQKPLNELTATELRTLLQQDEISAEQICSSCWEVVEQNEATLKAWEHLSRDLIFENARLLDKKRQNTPLGSLGGIPVGVKDVFNTKDYPTEMGSEIWKGFKPGNDARVVHYLREDDGLIFGKTVTAEFAVHYLPSGKTTNPHNSKYIPGTSSSGSAAAVAAKMVPVSLGTQTAGSIIRPASYCGVYGFKPTFGTVPRTGVLKTADTLDTIGCFANSTDDLKLVFNVIRVNGTDYPFVYNNLKPDFSLQTDQKLRIGYIIDGLWVFDEFPQYSKDALLCFLDKLRKQNQFVIEKIILDNIFNEIHHCHSLIYDKGLAYYFNNEFRNSQSALSDLILQSIENGGRISSHEFHEALQRQVEIRDVVSRQLQEFDIILCLSTSGEPPLCGNNELPDLCLIWTFLGNPSLSIPLFRGPNNMPFGLQIVAAKYDDFKLLEFAQFIGTLS